MQFWLEGVCFNIGSGDFAKIFDRTYGLIACFATADNIRLRKIFVRLLSFVFELQS